MQPERWKKIEQVFYAALPLPLADRDDFASAQCDGDRELSGRILTLLEEDDESSIELLESGAFELGASVIAAEEELRPGEMLGSYEIDRMLGCGGMGAVYLAEDKRLNRNVAIKVLPRVVVEGQSAIEHFHSEARAASGISHSNIAHIYEFGEAEGRYFIAMEYVDGSTLREIIIRGKVESISALDYVKQTALALAAAHRSGIVHRDIKPENIIVTNDGLVKVLDFGLAHRLDRQDNSEGVLPVLIGTASYMSPEQIGGQPVDQRTDIWSLGVVLYELLAGSRPFSGADHIELREAILTKPVPAAVNDGGLSRVVIRCLNKDPDSRYQTAQALHDDISLNQKRTQESGKQKWTWITAGLIVTILAAIGLWSYGSRNTEPAEPRTISSIAVLPFANANAKEDYLADGMSETLINRLSQLPNLTVKARSSVFKFKGGEVDPKIVGSELGVQAVLQGKISVNGDSLVLNLSLVDAANGNQIWGEQYSCQTSDIIKLQNEIAVDVTEKLHRKLSGLDQQRLVKAYTQNPKAYNDYLIGRFHWNKRTGSDLRKSVDYYESAIALDPNFALAYAGLADSYVLFPSYAGASPEEAFPKAEAAARKALEMDESLAEAHTALSYALFNYEWKFDESEKQISRAIELNPNYATAYHWLGNANLLALGRFDESIEAMKKANELDPLSLIIKADLATSYCYALRLDEAIAQYNKTLEMDGNFYYAHVYLGRAYLLKGDYEKALDELQKASSLNRDPRIPMLRSRIYSKMGRKSDALSMLEELKEMRKERYISNFDFALVYTGLGDLDNAFRSLENSLSGHDGNLVYLKADPLLAELRDDPRYFDLVKRIGLEK